MKRKFLLKFLGITILTAILAVAAFCSAGYFRSAEAELPDVSYFSTERFQEPDGTVASVFASGDQYYNYLHDAKGRLLVPDGEGYLRYAESAGGKPVATATRWNADERSVLKTNTMFASDVDFEKNPELRNEFGAMGASIDVSNLDRSAQNAYREGAAANAAADETAEIPKIVNSVVFLRFPDESERIVTEGVLQSLSNIDGQNATLNDYFRCVSSETFGFYNVLPYLEDGSIFVYTAPNPISYYRSVDSTGLTRQREEGKLLGGALEAAKPYLEKGIADSGLKTDADGDGSVDSVTFLVLSDEPGKNAWNTLLWPHQWSFGAVFVTETLGNAKADRYLFMFTSSSRFFPVLTHEMGHVVGAPDLYHYSGSYDPVGYYDNMASSSGASPNLWLTATREKYLADAVGAHQVSEITENWDGYTLKATSSAAQKDLLAYKIRLNASEWLYIEYRQPNVGRYDNNFDLRFGSAQSGLVVYRVKEGVYGNDAAKAPGSGYYSSPDEIYVFRNSDISTAALKEPNASIGSESITTLYQDGNLYTTNGRNSGIVVTLKEIDTAAATARFEVYHKDFPKYSGSEALVGLSASKLAETEETLPQSAFYGQDFDFEIFPVYQKGKVKIIGDAPISTELFTVTGYDKFDKSFSAQRVSVSLDLEKAAKAGYAAAEGAVFPTLSFSVTVKDYDLNLEILSLTNKIFLVGTADGFVADWIVVTAMGKTSAAYNAASPETKSLRYEFLESADEFTKTARVIFGELSAVIEINFYDNAVSMRYVGETSFLYGSEPLSFLFEISYLSGKKETIKVSAAEIKFSETAFGAQTLEYATENLKTVFTVYVYKNVASYRLMKNGETALREEEINLRYAETIDFSAYVLSVRFENESADTELPLEGRIPSKIYTYDEKVVVPFAEAYQNGKAVSVTFRVTVALKNDFELLSATHKNVKIDYTNRLIVLQTAMDSAELSETLKTAAYLSVVCKNGDSGAAVELVNRVSGAVLSNFRFAVVLKGDANGDGIADADDVEALAGLYLQDDSAYRNAVGDKNGDGKYTLIDFSLWLQALSGDSEHV